MNVTTWGELDRSWLNKDVIVRWEDAAEPLFDGGPAGFPHEWRGRICHDGYYYYYYLSTHALDRTPPDAASVQLADGFPDHALVQEVPQ